MLSAARVVEVGLQDSIWFKVVQMMLGLWLLRGCRFLTIVLSLVGHQGRVFRLCEFPTTDLFLAVLSQLLGLCHRLKICSSGRIVIQPGNSQRTYRQIVLLQWHH